MLSAVPVSSRIVEYTPILREMPELQVGNYAIAQFTPVLFDRLGFRTFLIFGVFSFAALLLACWTSASVVFGLAWHAPRREGCIVWDFCARNQTEQYLWEQRQTCY